MPGSIGSALSSLGNVAPSFLGGGEGGFLGNAGSYLSNLGAGTTGSMDPGTGYVPSGVPGAPVSADGSSSGGLSAAPSMTEATAGPGTSGPGTFGAPSTVAPPAGAPAGTPGNQSWWQSLLFGNQQQQGTGTGPATGTGPSKAGWPGILSPTGLEGIAAGSTDFLKYLQQRSLLNPSAINSAANQLAKNQAAMLKKSIFPAITATGQETGNINSPYLMSQAYTAAAAPEVAQINEAALNQWLQANQLAGGMYPGTSALGGFVEPNIFGGGASS